MLNTNVYFGAHLAVEVKKSGVTVGIEHTGVHWDIAFIIITLITDHQSILTGCVRRDRDRDNKEKRRERDGW